MTVWASKEWSFQTVLKAWHMDVVSTKACKEWLFQAVFKVWHLVMCASRAWKEWLFQAVFAILLVALCSSAAYDSLWDESGTNHLRCCCTACCWRPTKQLKWNSLELGKTKTMWWSLLSSRAHETEIWYVQSLSTLWKSHRVHTLWPQKVLRKW